MKIVTWNIERPTKTGVRIQAIIKKLNEVDADILILTETNHSIHLGDSYNYFHTSLIPNKYYKEGERRVIIYSKYNSVSEHVTFRTDTSVCIELETSLGSLLVYGTVMGIFGNRQKDFEIDLDQQLLDFETLSQKGNLCIAGDLNMSFSDNYYFTTSGRNKLNMSFQKLNLRNLTAHIPQNIDHIILPRNLLNDKEVNITTWNMDKKLSDHIGIAIEII
jgi:endonuclease/exonuclease/phosphatase family metal-dependent hydrolase